MAAHPDDAILDDDTDDHDFLFDNEKEDALLAETDYDFIDTKSQAAETHYHEQNLFSPKTINEDKEQLETEEDVLDIGIAEEDIEVTETTYFQNNIVSNQNQQKESKLSSSILEINSSTIITKQSAESHDSKPNRAVLKEKHVENLEQDAVSSSVNENEIVSNFPLVNNEVQKSDSKSTKSTVISLKKSINKSYENVPDLAKVIELVQPGSAPRNKKHVKTIPNKRRKNTFDTKTVFKTNNNYDDNLINSSYYNHENVSSDYNEEQYYESDELDESQQTMCHTRSSYYHHDENYPECIPQSTDYEHQSLITNRSVEIQHEPFFNNITDYQKISSQLSQSDIRIERPILATVQITQERYQIAGDFRIVRPPQPSPILNRPISFNAYDSSIQPPSPRFIRPSHLPPEHRPQIRSNFVGPPTEIRMVPPSSQPMAFPPEQPIAPPRHSLHPGNFRSHPPPQQLVMNQRPSSLPPPQIRPPPAQLHPNTPRIQQFQNPFTNPLSQVPNHPPPIIHSDSVPSSQIRGPPPQIRCLPPQIRGPPPQIRGLPPQIRGPPPQIRGPPPQIRGPSPHIRGPPPNIQRPSVIRIPSNEPPVIRQIQQPVHMPPPCNTFPIENQMQLLPHSSIRSNVPPVQPQQVVPRHILPRQPPSSLEYYENQHNFLSNSSVPSPNPAYMQPNIIQSGPRHIYPVTSGQPLPPGVAPNQSVKPIMYSRKEFHALEPHREVTYNQYVQKEYVSNQSNQPYENTSDYLIQNNTNYVPPVHSPDNHYRPQKRNISSSGNAGPSKQTRFEYSNNKKGSVIRNLHEVKTVDSMPDTTSSYEIEDVHSQDEDEDMKLYRKKVEYQKKLREKFVQMKEEQRLKNQMQTFIQSNIKGILQKREQLMRKNEPEYRKSESEYRPSSRRSDTYHSDESDHSYYPNSGSKYSKDHSPIRRVKEYGVKSDSSYRKLEPVVTSDEKQTHKTIKIKYKDGSVALKSYPVSNMRKEIGRDYDMESSESVGDRKRTIATKRIPVPNVQNDSPMLRNENVIVESVRKGVTQSSIPLAQRFSNLKPAIKDKEDTLINPTKSKNRLVIQEEESRTVLIKNIARNTNPALIQRMANTCGTTLNINWISNGDRSTNQAKITFTKTEEAKKFCINFNRKMIDLSLITVSLISETN